MKNVWQIHGFMPVADRRLSLGGGGGGGARQLFADKIWWLARGESEPYIICEVKLGFCPKLPLKM